MEGGCRFPDWRQSIIRDIKLLHYDTVILLYQGWGYNYYHFLIETFLRLFHFPNYKDLIANSDVHFIVPKSGHFDGKFAGKFVTDYFNLIGVSSNRLITLHNHQMLLVKRLIVPRETSCIQASPHQMQEAQAYFFQLLSSKLEVKLALERYKLRQKLLDDGCETLGNREETHWILVMKRPGTVPRHVSNHYQMVKALKAAFPCEVFKVRLQTKKKTASSTCSPPCSLS